MADYLTSDVVDKILNSVKEEYEKLPKLNIMILGKTGVGKSTLINSIFGDSLVRTGIGRPVTSDIVKVEKKDFPLALYDTPGLELTGDNAYDSLSKQVIDVIREGFESSVNGSGNEIHCLLYCVSSASHRFEPSEAAFLKKIADKVKGYNVPVIIVLTQSFSKRDAAELRGVIEAENLPISSIVPVLAQDYEIDVDMVKKAYGIDDLAKIIAEILPEAIQNTFIALEKANLKLKIKRARGVVATAAAGALATGAIPLPIADAAVLVPDQIAMLAGITSAFGFPVDKGALMTVISGTIGSAGATVLGRNVVSGLLKLIPGAGTVAGAVVSGATAAAITYALGEAYVQVLTAVSRGEMKMSDINTEIGREEINRMFLEKLKMRRLPSGEAEEESEVFKDIGDDSEER